jgi:hypothetical protein
MDPCTPMTCAELGFTCGATDNGCGVSIDCGVCVATSHCVEHSCVSPTGEGSDGGAASGVIDCADGAPPWSWPCCLPPSIRDDAAHQCR